MQKGKRLILLILAAVVCLSLLLIPVSAGLLNGKLLGKAGEIVTDPKDYVGNVGDIASFQVEAKGSGLRYQWYYSNNGGRTWDRSTALGATTDTLYINLTADRVGQLYRCTVTDYRGAAVNSKTAKLVGHVTELRILSQPQDFAGKVGDTATFRISAQGDAVQYQWYYSNSGGDSWVPSGADGADTDTLTIAISRNRNGQMYCCIVTDVRGETKTSRPAVLQLVENNLPVPTEPVQEPTETEATEPSAPTGEILSTSAGQAVPPVVSFVDDDGTAMEYSVLFPWMQENEVPYTFAIPVGSIGGKALLNGQRKYCTWEELAIMKKSDLVTFSCHCVGDDVMNKFSVAEMDNIVYTWYDTMKAKGLVDDKKPVTTYMYCHGTYTDPVVRDVVSRYFRAGFTVEKGINTTPFDSFHMKRVGLFPSSGGFTLADAKKYVDEVYENGGWLVFFTHSYYDTFDLKGLTELVEYIRSKNVEIAGVEDVLDRYGNLVNCDSFNKSKPNPTYSVTDYLGNVYSSDGPVAFDFQGTPKPVPGNQ